MAIPLSLVALVLLAVQNATQMVLMRMSRTQEVTPHASVAVTMQELVKLLVSFLFLIFLDKLTLSEAIESVKNHTYRNGKDFLKLSVPGVLYTIQNMLLYVAMSYLNATTTQVLYQMKILTTAVFAVIILKKQLRPVHWGGLLLLTCGAALAQYASASKSTPSADGSFSGATIGFFAVLLACVTSGFAGIYFEAVLKHTKPSIWIRNVQLAVYGVASGIFSILVSDYDSVSERGLFSGFTTVAWSVVFIVSAGGLLVAVVVKYADNIAKAFACCVAIILSAFYSIMFLNMELSPAFILGCVLVIGATFVYTTAEAPKSKPVSMEGDGSDISEKI